MEEVVIFEISSNPIGKLPAELLSQFPNIFFVSLIATSLQSLPDGFFKNITNLGILNLQVNRELVELPGSIREVPQISNLDLRGCSALSEIEDGFFEGMTVRSLFLRDVPIVNSENLESFAERIEINTTQTNVIIT